MVPHAGQPLDHGGHPRQGPQVGPKAVGPRSLAQRPVDLGQLSAVQLRLAARPAGGPQGPNAAPLPLAVPAADALAAHPEGSSHRCQNLAGSE